MVSSALITSGWATFGVALAVGSLMLAASLVALARPRGAWLRHRLDPQGRLDGLQAGSGAAVLAAPGWRPQQERLYGATERMLEGTRAWKAAMRLLERAGSHLRPAAFAWASLLIGVGAACGSAVFSLPTGVTVLALIVGLVAPTVWMKIRAVRRLRAFDDQLADILMTMAGSLRVGVSFTHSMAVVVENAPSPASEEFERVLNEVRLGRSMEEALAALANRIGSEELRFVLMSVVIQREVGGSLADLFETVSETVRERQQFRRKVKALTATGRMSAYLLLALPFVTGGAIAAFSPGYIHPLFTHPAGHVLLVIMVVLLTIGSFLLKRVTTIKG